MKCFVFVPAVALSLMVAGAACAQDTQVEPSAAHGGAIGRTSAKPKAAPKPSSQAKAGSQGGAAFDIIPCADAKGKVHKCIRIDPTAGEINDPAKGASYRVIYGQ